MRASLFVGLIPFLSFGCKQRSFQEGSRALQVTNGTADPTLCPGGAILTFHLEGGQNSGVKPDSIEIRRRTEAKRTEVLGASDNQNAVFRICMESDLLKLRHLINVTIVAKPANAGIYYERVIFPDETSTWNGLEDAIYGDISKLDFEIDDGAATHLAVKSLKHGGENYGVFIVEARDKEYDGDPWFYSESVPTIFSAVAEGDNLSWKTGPCGQSTYRKHRFVLGTAQFEAETCDIGWSSITVMNFLSLKISDTNPALASPLSLTLRGIDAGKAAKYHTVHHTTCEVISIDAESARYVLRVPSFAGAGCSDDNFPGVEGLPPDSDLKQGSAQPMFRVSYNRGPWSKSAQPSFTGAFEDATMVEGGTNLDNEEAYCFSSKETAIKSRPVASGSLGAIETCSFPKENMIRLNGKPRPAAEDHLEIDIHHNWPCRQFRGKAFIYKPDFDCN